MKPDKPHNSMRGYFSYHLYDHMESNENLYVVVGDLGFGMMDSLRDSFPARFINAGASEQAMMGIACGLAMSGKQVIVYSITPFLIFRALETIRNYVNAEKLNVKLIGSGRNQDYEHDGLSHWASDVTPILDVFTNISQYYPLNKEEIKNLLIDVLKGSGADFISLSR